MHINTLEVMRAKGEFHMVDNKQITWTVRVILANLLVVACLACVSCANNNSGDANNAMNTTSTTAQGSTQAEDTQNSAVVSDQDNSESQSDAEATSALACPSTTGKLRVSGTQLVSDTGQPVQLRGVSTHGLAWFPQYVNQLFFSELHNDWNANVVRLAMYTAESGGYCTDGNQAELLQLIDNGVTYATEADMYVIVDWHVLNDLNPLTHKDEALAFFQEVSAKYADHNNVIYEICNEPNGSTTWEEVKAYAEEVIPAIRANDPEAVILVGTPTWSQDVDKAAANPLSFDNIMYTMHFYAATHKDDLRNRLQSAVAAGLPVFVSEFGICDASGNGQIDYESANAWVQLMDSLDISYVCWNLSNKDEASALFNASCSKTSGFTYDDLSAEGQWLKATLADNRAKATATTSSANAAATSSSANARQSQSSNTTSTSRVSGTSGQFSWQLSKVNSWESDGATFIQYTLTITNEGSSTVNEWEVNLPFNQSPSLSDSWNGSYSVSGNTITISNVDYNGSIAAGALVGDVGFIVSGDATLAAQS